MHVELLDYTRDPEDAISRAASLCYDADTTPEANKKRILHLMRVGHLSPLRFAYATFHISEVSRVETHQHVRVAHGGILQQCVVGDTKIAVINNEKTGDIKQMKIKHLWDLQNGSLGHQNFKRRIRCFDETSKCFVISKIKEVFSNGVHPVFTLATDDLSITCTSEHKFLTPVGFKPLKEINVGDLIARNGIEVYKDVEVKSITPAGVQDVYDLEVEHDSHNYIANKFVVHNSQRYTSCTPEYLIRPPSFATCSKKVFDAVTEAEMSAFKAYRMLMEEHVHMEDARYILPQGISARLTMTGNFQMWHDWLKNRTSKHAQWEIRTVALRIQELLHSIAPNIFQLESVF